MLLTNYFIIVYLNSSLIYIHLYMYFIFYFTFLLYFQPFFYIFWHTAKRNRQNYR